MPENLDNPQPASASAHKMAERLNTLRKGALDLSRRNPLVSLPIHNQRTNAFFRIVDTSLKALVDWADSDQTIKIAPLPHLDDAPKDENSYEFRQALAEALAERAESSESSESNETLTLKEERAIKDEIRDRLGLPPIDKYTLPDILDHAKAHGVNPDFNLPSRSRPQVSLQKLQTRMLPETLERKLRGLYTRSQTWQQETGINVLYLTLGIFEYHDRESGRDCFAPILLYPVELTRTRTPDGAIYTASCLENSPQLNMAFSEMLSTQYDLALPDIANQSAIDYLERLRSLDPMNLKTRIRNFAQVGTFPSARLAIYRDLDPASSDITSHQIVSDLLGGSKSPPEANYATEYTSDDWSIDSETPAVIGNVDSSQFSALIDIRSGRNISIEGPPGTGKSETIVNAIADAISSGKKVLFVASKMAALNVVKDRLAKVGLADFCLPLLAGISSRKAFFSSVKNRIELPTPAEPYPSDEIREELSEIATELNTYARFLAEEYQQTGLTRFEIISKASSVREVFNNLPRSIRLTPIRNIGLLKNDQIARAKTAFLALAEALQCLSSDGTNWTEYAGPPVNEFILEDIFDEIDLLIELNQASLEHTKYLTSHRIESLNTAEALNNFHASLQTIRAAPEDLRGGFFADLFTTSCPAKASEYLKVRQRLTSLNRSHKDLTGTDVNVEDAIGLSEFLNDLTSRFDRTNTLSDAAANIAKKATLLRRHTDRLTVVLDVLGDAYSTTVFTPRQVNRAIRLINATSDTILRAHSQIQFQDFESKRTTSALARLETLQESIARLTGTIEDPLAVARSSEFTDIRSDLTDDSPSRFLRPRYYRAKRRYKSITGQPFRKPSSLTTLSELSAIREQAAIVSSNPVLAKSLGSLFEDETTDVKLVKQCVSLRVELKNIFSDDTAFLSFLLNSDSSALYKLKGPPLADTTGTLKDLENNLHCKLSKLNAVEQIIGQWSDLERNDHTLRGLKVSALQDVAEMRTEALAYRAQLKSLRAERRLFAKHFSVNTNTKVPVKLLDILRQLERLALPNTDDVSKALSVERDRVEAAVKALVKLSGEYAHCMARFSQLTGEKIVQKLASLSPDKQVERLYMMRADKEGLYHQSALLEARSKFNDTKFDGLMRSLVNTDVAPHDFVGVFEAVVYSKLVRAVFETNSQNALRYGRKVNDALRRRADVLEDNLRKSLKEEIVYGCFHQARPRSGQRGYRVRDHSDLQLLKHEIQKKQRFISVRDAMKRAGQALRELKPCWMMSPLAVAQYIDRSAPEFDLCIIDEASQMVPSEALGAISRSKQVVVVGDRNQLPPTTFYQVKGPEEEPELSILDLANLAFEPIRQLRWHYRSKHPSLIKFCNHHIYGNRLIIPPTPNIAESKSAVYLHPVDGTYKNGLNTEEARKVVASAIELMASKPEKSIGIATMNIKQAELIREELELAINSNPQAQTYMSSWEQKDEGRNSVFVKNLENVQGDERDIILISTLYGPEKLGGTVAQRFGPVAGPTGPRRLNVLFSRARHMIITFSSMKASDIRADELANPGRYMLKNWLSFCETGELGARRFDNKEPDSEFEQMVIDSLEQLGYGTHAQVGEAGFFIDIGVYHHDWPHGYLLGVECDGASYHSSASARERDKHRQDILEERGWKIHRIWSTDWFRDKKAELLLLETKLQDILSLKAAQVSRPTGIPRDPDEERQPDAARVGKNVASNTNSPETLAALEASEQLGFDLDSSSEGAIKSLEDAPRFSPLGTRATTLESASVSDQTVECGDLVSIRFLDGAREELSYQITDGMSDLALRRINEKTPLAQCLLGSCESEELEFSHAGKTRTLMIEKIDRK